MTGTLSTAAQPKITSLGTLESLNVTNGITAATLTGVLQSVAQTNITSLGTLESLNVTGNVAAGNVSATAYTGSRLNLTGNVAVGNVSATAYTGSRLNLTGNAAVGNITATTISGTLSTTSQPGITSVGTLSSLNVTGDVAAGNVSSNGITGTALRVQTASVLNSVSDTTVLPQGTHLAWNSFPGGTGETTMINKCGTGTGGFSFYQSTGSDTSLSNKTLLGSISSSGLRLGSQFPIQFAEFSVEGGASVATGYSVANWHPCLVQFNYSDGDIQEIGSGDIIKGYFVENLGNWDFAASFRIHNNQVTVFAVCMFINKTMTGQTPLDYRL
jgi:hypothetical protein